MKSMMTKSRALGVFVALALGSAAGVRAQEPVTANTDHAAMLASPDPALAANKRLVYDFWREVFEGGHLDLAEKYLTPGYIQHNPLVPTGREAFVQFFGRFKKPVAIEPKVKGPLVSVVAERDLVILSFVRQYPDPAGDPARVYTTTWFDMFRIEGGKIAEHWDPATKPAAAARP